MFDINDFDETLPGPWEWDVKRLAVSMMVAARNSGFSVNAQERIVLDAVAEYRTRMAQFAAMRNLEVWYTRFEIDELMPQLRSQVKAKMRKRLNKVVAKAVSRDHMHAFARLSQEVDGERRIVSEPPLIVRLDDFADTVERDRIRADLKRLLREYSLTLQHERRALLEQFRLVDLARKVVGVGSVGTGAWIALLLGRDGQDPLVLQIKEAQLSVMEEFVGASEYRNSGERVVAGQRIMQASSDIFLGWLKVDRSIYGGGRDYYVRQLRDWKGSAVVEAMDPRALSVYGQLCATTLAHAHARSGDRIASPPTSAVATCSTARSSRSPRLTPSKTTATTRRSATPSRPAEFLPSTTCTGSDESAGWILEAPHPERREYSRLSAASGRTSRSPTAIDRQREDSLPRT